MKPRAVSNLLAGVLASVVLYLMIASIGRDDAEAHRLSGHPKTVKAKLDLAKRQVAHDRRELATARTRYWTLLAPLPVAAFSHRYWLQRDVRYVRQLERALSADTLGPSWLVRAFLCIHNGEGSWTANTGNGYYGGLQMDYGFMRAYGGQLLASKGTADHWTPAEQISVAIRAYLSGRGFYPWPNTARYCGLI